MEVATGFAAFDASTGGVMEIPQTRKGSLATVATTATGAAGGSETMRSLDAITLAEPLSASPTVARHMVLSPGYAPPGAAAVLSLVPAQAVAVPEKERERVEERAQQGGGDDDSFESDGSERLIIRKEMDLGVRYSPVAMRKEAAASSGGVVSMGFDLERIEESGEWRSESFESGRNAADAERWRGASLEIGRARGGESLDIRREADMGRIPIGLSVERGRRASTDSGNGRLGSWFETETPKGRGSWESGGDDRQVEKRYKGSWREQREKQWGRR
ncbi:hypothetical protein MPH_01715 [Macrophomina phaseolina MS6]|uniref:Uncharacterized protein n=1 Tax=Macrophomina phaseolina (strain MS6) TaxID=1126212 RepID=K2S1T7_MACPH|nr:hypothetical protein MPH_01715 [Macrophomina phaseolina MS6]